MNALESTFYPRYHAHEYCRWTVHAADGRYRKSLAPIGILAPRYLLIDVSKQNALNYYFSIILQDNLGMSELMARVLTGANATSYCISTAMAFWIIDRRGRRFLMLTGLSLQCAAYIMVAIAVAMLATAPQQVSCRDNTYAYILIYADTSKWGAVAITFLFAYYAAFGYVS